MKKKTLKIDEKTADQRAWLARDRKDPIWQGIRDGLAKILPDDLSGYEGRRIRDIEHRNGGPVAFELNDESYVIELGDFHTNLDWLALHCYKSWMKN